MLGGTCLARMQCRRKIHMSESCVRVLRHDSCVPTGPQQPYANIYDTRLTHKLGNMTDEPHARATSTVLCNASGQMVNTAFCPVYPGRPCSYTHLSIMSGSRGTCGSPPPDLTPVYTWPMLLPSLCPPPVHSRRHGPRCDTLPLHASAPLTDLHKPSSGSLHQSMVPAESYLEESTAPLASFTSRAGRRLDIAWAVVVCPHVLLEDSALPAGSRVPSVLPIVMPPPCTHNFCVMAKT